MHNHDNIALFVFDAENNITISQRPHKNVSDSAVTQSKTSCMERSSKSLTDAKLPKIKVTFTLCFCTERINFFQGFQRGTWT